MCGPAAACTLVVHDDDVFCGSGNRGEEVNFPALSHKTRQGRGSRRASSLERQGQRPDSISASAWSSNLGKNAWTRNGSSMPSGILRLRRTIRIRESFRYAQDDIYGTTRNFASGRRALRSTQYKSPEHRSGQSEQWNWSSCRHYAWGERGPVLVNEAQQAEMRVRGIA